MSASADPDLMLTGSAGARCALWWTNCPTIPGERIGLIGRFHASDFGSAGNLLNEACRLLANQRCSMAIGPMDGSTWKSYRLVTETGSEPPFFLEPTNPPEWPRYFEGSGFSTLANYTSALNSDLGQVDRRIEKVRERMRSAGIVIRPIRLDEFDQELRHIFEVSIGSFVNNFLYTPIDYSQFEALYLPIRQAIKPELVLLAFDRLKCVGFVFAVPNFAESKSGQPIKTTIVKSLAVLPGRQMAGLGTLLLAEMQQAAFQLGYTRAIHALMHESNNSRNLSGHYATTMRRYALFSRPLA
jgi:L-amino acid N-acyltransferase YncA